MITRLVGFHYPAGQGGWGRDLLGMLLGETPEGWVIVGTHISSPGWSRTDIGRKAKEHEGVPYEWLGERTSGQIKEKCPPAPAEDEAEEVGDVVGPERKGLSF